MARPQADHRAAARLSRARRGGRRGTRTARRPHASDSARAARSAAQIRAVTSGPIQPHLHKRRRWRAEGGGGDGEGGPKGEAFCWEARERPPRRGATRREKVAMDKPSMPASQRVVADAQPPNREEEGGRAERKEVQGEQRGRKAPPPAARRAASQSSRVRGRVFSADGGSNRRGCVASFIDRI